MITQQPARNAQRNASKGSMRRPSRGEIFDAGKVKEVTVHSHCGDSTLTAQRRGLIWLMISRGSVHGKWAPRHKRHSRSPRPLPSSCRETLPARRVTPSDHPDLRPLGGAIENQSRSCALCFLAQMHPPLDQHCKHTRKWAFLNPVRLVPHDCGHRERWSQISRH